jgi:CheY-like chemotaxis protein
MNASYVPGAASGICSEAFMNSRLGLVATPTAHVGDQVEDAPVESADSTQVAEHMQEGEVASSEAETQPVQQQAPVTGEDAPRKVLIVEDTTELAEVIAATLERINIVTLHETHVERALNVYYAEHPDVILLDIGLPDKTGWKMLDAIKEHAEEDRPVVVVITAHGDPANRLMGKLQGVHSYLIKPFTPNEVEQVVGTALSDQASPTPVMTEGKEVVEEGALPDFIKEVVDDSESPTPGESEAPDN